MPPNQPNQPENNSDNPMPDTVNKTAPPIVSTAPGQAEVAANNTAPQPGGIGSTPNGGAKKKIPGVLLIVGLAVLLLGGGAAAYFTSIAANKPENIWARALDNTNKGYEKVVEYMKETKDQKDYNLEGDFKFDAASVVVDGNIKGKVGEKDADLTIDVGAAGSRVNVNMLVNTPDNSKYPDIYVKASGLKGIGQLMGGADPEVGNLLTEFDNQWYAIDHTLFEQMDKQSGTDTAASSANLSSEDIIAIAEAVGRVNAEYLFTDDEGKAVLRVTENVGRVSLDGRSAYHFKVGYNKENMKKYATAMKDELKKTKVIDLVPNKDLEKAINFEEMLKEIDNLSGDGTADAWVDMETKLIRKIRFTEKDKPENYLDLIFNYNGGDDYPLLIVFHDKDESEETNVSIGATLNTKQDTAEYSFEVKTTGGNPVSATANFRMTPSSEKVQFKKPEGAKPLTDLLGGLMGGQLPMPSGGEDQFQLDGLDELEL